MSHNMTKIKNIKITDAKPSANELARFAEVQTDERERGELSSLRLSRARRKWTNVKEVDNSQVTEPLKERSCKRPKV